jgi:cell division protein FtsB
VSWGRKIIVLAVLIVLGFGLFRLFREKEALTGEVKKMRAQFESLTEENKDLAAKIEYFKNPANLLKEIKSQFNYREEGEKLIIIVPGATSSNQ